MLPTINGKPIIECGKEDFEVIIENPDYRENEYIDYKRSFSFLEIDKNDPKREEHISEFRSDVCAFANADGGYLIYGIKEKAGVASELEGIDIPNNTDKFELERKNNLQSILPKIPSVKFKFVLLDNGKYLVVILIQRDAFAPYIHLNNKQNYIIYKRIGNGKTAMSYSELKMQFNQSLSLSQEIECFRKERISFFQNIEDDDEHSYSRFALLHIIPDTFVDPSHNKPMYVKNRMNGRTISSIFRDFACSEYTRSNVDGIRSTGYDGKQESQIYNNGIAECFIPVQGVYVDNIKVCGEIQELFFYKTFQENMQNAVDNYIEVFPNVLDSTRIFVCLSIIGCRNVLTDNSGFVKECPKIDRSMMILSPVVFENIADEEATALSKERLDIEYELALGLRLSNLTIHRIETGQI